MQTLSRRFSRYLPRLTAFIALTVLLSSCSLPSVGSVGSNEYVPTDVPALVAEYALETNLLQNGTFDGGNSHWTNYGRGWWGVNWINGNATMEIGNSSWLQQAIAADPGKNFQLTLDGQAINGGTCVAGLRGGAPTNELFRKEVAFTGGMTTKATSVVIPATTTWIAVYLADWGNACRYDNVRLVQTSGSGQVATAAPVFTPATQTFGSSVDVGIASLTSGATIYYTLDGSAPTQNSSRYSSPIHLTATTTIKALAVASGMTSSNASASYTHTVTATPVPTPTVTTGGTRTFYSESNDDIPNPERGFRRGIQLMGYGNFAGIRYSGQRVVQAYISLQNYKNGAIPDWYLQQMRTKFQALRDNGIKASVRFWYSWAIGEADASPTTIMHHINQVRPILWDYSDVILVVQAGFIGAWGEWHSETYPDSNTDGFKRQVVQSLIASLNYNRKVQLRYVGALRIFVPNGMNMTQSVSDPVLSRIGFHNDCFMINQSDAGTYAWDNPQRDADRNYLQSMTPMMPVGGEMCGDVNESTYDPYNRRTPTGQLGEFARFNWSWISNDFGPVQRWRDWGIYDTIAKKLGYRLVAQWAEWPTTASGNFAATVQIANRGWAAPIYNRPVQLVLKNASRTLSFNANVDVRYWQSGSTPQVTFYAVNVPSGSYTMYVNLPDSAPTIANRPDYSIQLANNNMWDAGLGMNRLGEVNVQ